MKIFQTWISFFDGDDHPSPGQMSLNATLDGAMNAVRAHHAENPKRIERAYGNEHPNRGTIKICEADDNVYDLCGSYTYFICEIEVGP